MEDSMKNQPRSIYTTRNEKIHSQKDEKITFRTARFLNPSAQTLNQAVFIPKQTPLLSEIFPHNLLEWQSKVLFKGWKIPQKKWKEWVLQLSPKYSHIWKKSGIYEAIMSSIYEIRPSHDLVLGLSEFWCPVTNTFVFPWGEATITLEDILILGGYPVLGMKVTDSINSVERLVQEMEKQRIEFSRRASHKASHGGWLTYFMGLNDGFEHLAFLCLWLSRFVLTSLPEKVIGKHVFPIAARLSLGTPIALAPAVLASIYRDLSLLRKEAITCSKSITITAPFQLVQLWAFERFSNLGPKNPNPLEWLGEPRAACWHKLSSKVGNLPVIRSAFRVEDNFKWRPYSYHMNNWRPPPHYQEREQRFLDISDLGMGFRQFAKCLQGCRLEGLGFRELYLPHRVGRQFGFDQDIPAAYKFEFHGNLGQVKFFVPSKSYEPGVSEEYLKWWKNSMVDRKMTIKNSLETKIFNKYSRTLSIQRQTSVSDFRGFPVQRKNASIPKREVRVYEDDAISVSSGYKRPSSNISARHGFHDRKEYHSSSKATNEKFNTSDAKTLGSSQTPRFSSAMNACSRENFRKELSKDAMSVSGMAKNLNERKYSSSTKLVIDDQKEYYSSSKATSQKSNTFDAKTSSTPQTPRFSSSVNVFSGETNGRDHLSVSGMAKNLNERKSSSSTKLVFDNQKEHNSDSKASSQNFNTGDAKTSSSSQTPRFSSAMNVSPGETFRRDLSRNAMSLFERKCASSTAREVKRKVSDSRDTLDHVILSKRVKARNDKRTTLKGNHQKWEVESKGTDRYGWRKHDGSSGNERLGLIQRMERIEEIVGVKSNYCNVMMPLPGKEADI